MTTAQQQVPTEVTATEARVILADLIDVAQHHGRPTAIIRRGKVAARLVGPDAGRMPGPDLWQNAQEALDGLKAYTKLPADVRRFVDAGHALLAAHFDYDQEG